MPKELRYTLAPRAVSILVLVLALTACGPSGDGTPEGRGDASADADGPPLVVTTVGMLASTAERIAGERMRVEALMGPGVDPHLYKATAGDLRRLQDAALILYVGLNLEGKMADVLVRMARSRPVISVGEAVPEEARREPPAFEGHYDPHVWFDVSLWTRILDTIAKEMSAIDPEGAETYRANAEALRAEYEDLHAWVLEQVAQIPDEQRVLVTAHDAFGYFGERYGFDVVGIQGISTATEAGLSDVERVVDLVVEHRVPAIFVEASVPPRAIESVQAAARARGHEVAIGGELYSDSMGPAGSGADTYEGMVRHNVTTLVEALR
jgi:manganese/zinc/iron transport system substrate-binding protein